MSELRWGIMGTGGIAAAMVGALQAAGSTVMAVGSGRPGAAAAFATEWGIASAVESHAGVAELDNVDIVYVASSNDRHLDNVLAAIDVGLTTVDATLGGLGGCPFAPGASGNIVTEDLVFMLEAMGLRTGIDIDALLAARQLVEAALPGEEMFGFLPDAGLPKGFEYAAAR